jgi:beta-N-acetylhexosaminidase
LSGRCYGKNVEQVLRNAGAFNEAMRGQGIASCGKHFPGYSAATSDAHYQLPRIDRTREELDRDELAVFRYFVGRGGSPNRPEAIEVNRPYLSEGIVDSMMICHGWYPCFEPQSTPATLSRRIVTELLRNELGFDGLIMTDDLDMGAILTAYRLDDTIRLAINAGNDIVMICHRIPEIETVREVLSKLPSDKTDVAFENVARFKEKLIPSDKFSESAFRDINSEIGDLRMIVVGEERAGQSPSKTISPVEMF